jgi:trigger factor
MSNFEVKEISNCKKEISITIPSETVDSIREKEIAKFQKSAQLPGFRKGKVPKSMLMKTYAGTIEQNTIDEAINLKFREGAMEKELNPIDSPVLKDMKFDDDKNLTVVLEVEVFPEIELKKYKDLKLNKTVYEISDKDVEMVIDNIRHEKATISPVEDGAKDGNILTVEMQELDEQGVPIIGKKYENFKIGIGSGQFDADMEKQLIGVKRDEERQISKTYSKKDKDEKLAGKTEKFLVTVKTVEEEFLPEVDDEFVKQLGIDEENVNGMRDKIKHNLEHSYSDQAEQQFYNQLAHELLKENEFDVPNKMVEEYLDRIVEDIKNKDKKVDEAAVRKNYLNDATFNMKWFYLKDKISQVEKLEVKDEDINKYLENIEDEKMKEQFSSNPEWRRRISGDLAEKKILDFLIENQKIKEVFEPINKERIVK